MPEAPAKKPELPVNDAISGVIWPLGIPSMGTSVPAGSSPSTCMPVPLIPMIEVPSGRSKPSGIEGRPPITISSWPTASRIRHARRGCLSAHQRRREIKVVAKVKLTISQTTPRTANQLTSPKTMSKYQGSCCPTSSTIVNTTATVRLGSRSGFIKSMMRHIHDRSVFAFNMHTSVFPGYPPGISLHL